MIKFIQQKQIDFDLIQNLLADSISMNHFTNRGPVKYLLEQEIEKKLNISDDKRVIAVTNGTLALHALFILYNKKYKRNLKWASPSFTFPSSVVGGFKTNILDIDLETYTIPLNINLIDKYDGFIITNLFGTYPKNIMDWIKFCKNKNKILIFDNASSPATTINDININNLGDCSFGSLHHTKYLGFGEGGYIVIGKEFYEELNSILGFGFDGKTTRRVHSKYSSNFKIPDTSSVFILQHIKKYDIDKHKEIQNFLINEIKQLNNIEIFNFSEGVVYGNLPLLYDKKIDHLFFKDQGIEAHKYYYPLKRYKNSLYLYDRIVNLPLHSGLTRYEIEFILSVIKKSIK